MGNDKSRHASTGTCLPNETCVICQEDVADNVSRPDSCPDHYFHHDCLMKWAEHKNTCPLDNRTFHHVVDLKGKKVSVPKRKPSDDEGSEFLRRMLALLAILNRPSECGLCGNEAPELERANLSCGHRFHRSCLVKFSRFSRECPMETCNEDFTEISCEFGEKIELHSLAEDYNCCLCDRVDSDLECTVPDDCIHRNHLECMKQRCDRGDRTCPRCGTRIRFLRCDLGNRVVVDPSALSIYRCSICGEEDATKEKTTSTSCGHVFHRECVLGIFRTASTCPVEGCNGALNSLKCHFGDEFGHAAVQGQSNNFQRMLTEVTCDSNFICEVCHERRADQVRAKISCGCEFHHQCIIGFANREKVRKCPKCQTPFRTVQSMFGEVTVFEKDDEEEKGEEKEEETEEENKPPASAACAVAEMTCSLCMAEVEAGYGCRSSACAHLYHRVCLENIKDVGGSCLVCNKEVPLVVSEEEAGATASASPQPPPVLSTDAECDAPRLDSLCTSCHEVVDTDQKVHPDQCDHLYHLSCLVREISKSSHCFVCARPMRGVVVMEEDEDGLTGENCIICGGAVRESQKRQTLCCRQYLHQKCLQLHLEVIRECPACEIELPE